MPRAHLREIPMSQDPQLPQTQTRSEQQHLQRITGSHASCLIPGDASNSAATIFTSVAFAAELTPALFVRCTKLWIIFFKLPIDSVNISRLATELAHIQKNSCLIIFCPASVTGFNFGIDCTLSQNVICNNLRSTHAEPDVVDDLIKSGFMTNPDNFRQTPPFQVFRVSPIGVATRKFSGKKM